MDNMKTKDNGELLNLETSLTIRRTLLENNKIAASWNNSKSATDLLYGIETPTTEQHDSIRKEKETFCDMMYTPLIDKYFKNTHNKTFLEFGSGEGLMAKYMSHRFKKYICVDVITDFLELCKDMTSDCKNIEYELLENYYFTDFTVKDESVDIIISNNVFCHLISL